MTNLIGVIVSLSLVLAVAGCNSAGFATPAPRGVYYGTGNPLQGGGG